MATDEGQSAGEGRGCGEQAAAGSGDQGERRAQAGERGEDHEERWIEKKIKIIIKDINIFI